jgi:hypothetical protein
MAETAGILNDAPGARSPAANSWKLLYTAALPSVLSVHVNNGTAAASGFRIAIIPASVTYADGDVPPAYAMVSGSTTLSKYIEDLGEFDTPTYNVGVGDKVVVRCDNVGVTFMCQGFTFS